MNSNGKHNRKPLRDAHQIEYWRGSRMLRDTGEGFDGAKMRIEARLAKPHNRGERALICKNKRNGSEWVREVLFDTHPDQPLPR